MSKDYQKVCKMCGANFIAKRDDASCCSEKCIKQRISQVKSQVTDEDVKIIKELRLQGKTLNEISKVIGFSKVTLCKIMKQENLNMTTEQIAESAQRRWDKTERHDDQGRLLCSKCKQRKLPEEFSETKETVTGRRHSCKDCNNVVAKARYDRKKIEKELDEKENME